MIIHDRIRLIAIEIWRALSETKAPFAFNLECSNRLLQHSVDAHGFADRSLSVHFYSRELNEPPHIHIARDDFEVKFWLRPVSVAFNYGFGSTEVNEIRRLVEENCDFLLDAYGRFHGNR